MHVRCCTFGGVLSFLLSAPTAALGYNVDGARNNFAHELAECSAYYQFMAEAPRLNAAMKRKSLEASDFLLSLSVGLTTQELSLARFELALKTMMRDIDFNWENVSILLNKYAYPCKDVAEDPEARFKYWLKKKDSTK
jgi:hypothetical protein